MTPIMFVLLFSASAQASKLQCQALFSRDHVSNIETLAEFYLKIDANQFSNADQLKQAIETLNKGLAGLTALNKSNLQLFKDKVAELKNLGLLEKEKIRLAKEQSDRKKITDEIIIFDPVEINTLKHKAKVNQLVISPNEDIVVSISQDATAKVIRIATGEELYSVSHAKPINEAKISPDSKYLITASDDFTTEVRQLTDGKSLFTIPHTAEATRISISDDSHYVAVAALDGTQVYDLQTKQLIRKITHRQSTNDVVFTQDNQVVITGSSDGVLRFTNIVTGDLLKEISGLIRVNRLKVSPDGATLLTFIPNKTLVLIDLNTMTQSRAIQHDGIVNDGQFSQDGRYLITASVNKKATIIDTVKYEAVRTIDHKNAVEHAGFSYDGQWALTTASLDHKAVISDTLTGEEIYHVKNVSGIYDAVLTKNKKYIITAAGDGSVLITDLLKKSGAGPF